MMNTNNTTNTTNTTNATKTTMTEEVKEAIAKAREFAEAGEPEKVSGTVEPTQKPETKTETKTEGKADQKKTGKTESGQKTEGKKAGKTVRKKEPVEIMTKEQAVAELLKRQTERQMQKEFQKRSGVIEKNLASIENSFLTIAFNLQWIKKNEMHKKSGFKNIYEYAESVHGIGRTSCSNLICIVENFAERDENGEITEKIAECYKRFKQSQLVAMLGMNPEQIAKIDEKTSVRAINQMRKDVEIIQEGGKEEKEGDTGGADSGKNAGEKKPEQVKKYINTLIQFDSYNKYQKEIDEIDVLIERAFKKSTMPVTIKIVCEQG